MLHWMLYLIIGFISTSLTIINISKFELFMREFQMEYTVMLPLYFELSMGVAFRLGKNIRFIMLLWILERYREKFQSALKHSADHDDIADAKHD